MKSYGEQHRGEDYRKKHKRHQRCEWKSDCLYLYDIINIKKETSTPLEP